MNSSLRVVRIEEFTNISTHSIAEEIDATENIVSEQSYPVRKGINLPKSDADWSTADTYFKFALQLNAPMTNQSSRCLNITASNDVVYDYFAENFGQSGKIPDQ